MSDYTLYYWPLPFRGQFVRSVLAHVGASWTEADVSDLVGIKELEPSQQPVPFMGPPVLIDHTADLSLAQTQAILAYLGEKHDLMPRDPALAALTHKVIADANDVLYEITLHNGAQMWTRPLWDDFRPRLGRWMAIFEALGARYGLSPDEGHILGTPAPGLADLVTYSLWGVMTSKLPALRPILDSSAPSIAALSDRISRLSDQEELRRKSDAEYGEEWCSGQIEAALRSVI